MLPREFGAARAPLARLARGDRRIGAVAIAVVSSSTGIFAGDDPAFLASTYSFGVLFAFTAAQLAVIRLRTTRAGSRASVPARGRR